MSIEARTTRGSRAILTDDAARYVAKEAEDGVEANMLLSAMK
jgi:hypothetical protein